MTSIRIQAIVPSWALWNISRPVFFLAIRLDNLGERVRQREVVTLIAKEKWTMIKLIRHGEWRWWQIFSADVMVVASSRHRDELICRIWRRVLRRLCPHANRTPKSTYSSKRDIHTEHIILGIEYNKSQYEPCPCYALSWSIQDKLFHELDKGLQGSVNVWLGVSRTNHCQGVVGVVVVSWYHYIRALADQLFLKIYYAYDGDAI